MTASDTTIVKLEKLGAELLADDTVLYIYRVTVQDHMGNLIVGTGKFTFEPQVGEKLAVMDTEE